MGSFLDSTLDRIGDGAVFAGLILYFGRVGDTTLAAVALACLVGGLVVSYARAKAESLGFDANVGVAERAERLVSTLVATGLAGVGVPYVLPVTLWALAVLTLVTIVQRMVAVRRQALDPGRAAPGAPAAQPWKLRARASTFGYVAGWRLVRLLPEAVAAAVFRVIADVMWWRRGRLVQRYERNLRPLLPPDTDEAYVREVSRAGLRSYLRYWCEAFRLPSGDLSVVVRNVIADREHLLRDACTPERGGIAALPHMANWDLAGAWGCATGLPVTAVAERLDPEALFERFVAYREALGMQIIPLTGGVDPFPLLVKSIEEGRLVCLVADRDLTRNGVDVEIAGSRARMPAGPAVLALRTGAPLVPVTLHYEGPRMRLQCYDPIPRPPGLTDREAVVTMTQQLADIFGAAFQAHPHDWHMLQRFWLDPPEPGVRPVP